MELTATDKGVTRFVTVDNDILYNRTLQDVIALKKDIVLDFTSLKACLDPQRDGGLEFDYEAFIHQQLEKSETFSSLEVLKLRNLNITLPLTPQKEDYYVDLLHGTLQLSNLVELDLSGIALPQDLHQHLKFWNMQNLKRLSLDSMGLTTFPPSVGRLRQLEVLSVKNNELHDLPVTLAFCTRLKDLNLQNNKFKCLPGVLLRLPNLQELRRFGNPLPQLSSGFYQPPHIYIHTPSRSSRYLKPTLMSLQSLCTKVIFTHHIDYWANGTVGPLQCKTLDRLASQFTVCEHCNIAIPNKGKENLTVDVMLLRYLDLRFVPIQFTACSEECQGAVLQYYRELQTQTQAELDREYEESTKQAQKMAKKHDVDISTVTLGVPENHISHFVPGSSPRIAYTIPRHRQRKCAIM